MKTNTLVSAGAGCDENYVAAGEEDGPQSQTIFDFPPESFWVPKDSEQDWFHQNATMQRKSSFKLARFSVTGNCHHHHNSNPFSNRSLSTLNHHDHNKSSLLALPISDGNLWQNKAAAATRVLFRSRSEPGGKGRLVTDGAEPGSPVVSCTGRVRPMKKDGGKKTGLWKTLRTALRGRLGVRRPRVVNNAGSESAGSAGAESGRWSGSLSGNNN
ncbi:unnamed protein product [Cuscuta epithymum]|uniref:Uncharacterized protein n=1 Tax=Cuscuta epithymum TaxID=186058 RepID=A0AAV0E574_9ASTE|nr:unnamed protein product [Cuscuta epithymum]